MNQNVNETKWARFRSSINGRNTINQNTIAGIKGAVSRNSAKLGNYKMPIKLRET